MVNNGKIKKCMHLEARGKKRGDGLRRCKEYRMKEKPRSPHILSILFLGIISLLSAAVSLPPSLI